MILSSSFLKLIIKSVLQKKKMYLTLQKKINGDILLNNWNLSSAKILHTSIQTRNIKIVNKKPLYLHVESNLLKLVNSIN